MSYVMVTTYPNRKGICHGICHGVTLKSTYVMRYVMLNRHMSLRTVMCICHGSGTVQIICHVLCNVESAYVTEDCHVYISCLFHGSGTV